LDEKEFFGRGRKLVDHEGKGVFWLVERKVGEQGLEFSINIVLL
jgi:hypothetical protein